MTPATGVAPLRGPPADVDWRAVCVNAGCLAKDYVRPDEVTDAVNEGARRVLDGTAPWDEGSGMPLSEHVARVGIAALRASARTHQRRSGQVVRNTVVDSMAPPPSSPETIVARAETGRHLYDGLVGHFAGETAALAVLACMVGSIVEASDQAKHTGLDIEVVRNIRKRIDRRIAALHEGAAP